MAKRAPRAQAHTGEAVWSRLPLLRSARALRQAVKVRCNVSSKLPHTNSIPCACLVSTMHVSMTHDKRVAPVFAACEILSSANLELSSALGPETRGRAHAWHAAVNPCLACCSDRNQLVRADGVPGRQRRLPAQHQWPDDHPRRRVRRAPVGGALRDAPEAAHAAGGHEPAGGDGQGQVTYPPVARHPSAEATLLPAAGSVPLFVGTWGFVVCGGTQGSRARHLPAGYPVWPYASICGLQHLGML